MGRKRCVNETCTCHVVLYFTILLSATDGMVADGILWVLTPSWFTPDQKYQAQTNLGWFALLVFSAWYKLVNTPNHVKTNSSWFWGCKQVKKNQLFSTSRFVSNLAAWLPVCVCAGPAWTLLFLCELCIWNCTVSCTYETHTNFFNSAKVYVEFPDWILVSGCSGVVGRLQQNPNSCRDVLSFPFLIMKWWRIYNGTNCVFRKSEMRERASSYSKSLVQSKYDSIK